MSELRINPLVEGSYYEGDLLLAVIAYSQKSEDAGEALRYELLTIARRALELGVDICDREFYEQFGGHSPQEFGLDDVTVQRLKKQERANWLKHTPWAEFTAFVSNFGR